MIKANIVAASITCVSRLKLKDVVVEFDADNLDQLFERMNMNGRVGALINAKITYPSDYAEQPSVVRTDVKIRNDFDRELAIYAAYGAIGGVLYTDIKIPEKYHLK